LLNGFFIKINSDQIVFYSDILFIIVPDKQNEKLSYELFLLKYVCLLLYEIQYGEGMFKLKK